MAREIVILGHVVVETICFPDRTIPHVLGSPAACAGVIASKLGGRIRLATKIGTDFPMSLLARLREADVDLSGVVTDGPHSTTNLLVYDTSGQKQLVYLQRAPEIRFADIPRDYHSAPLFFLCPMDEEVPLPTIQALRGLNGQIMIDLGGYGGATSARHPNPAERPPTRLRELVALADIAKASAEDCGHLFGPEFDPEAIARIFVRWGAGVGIVTAGSRGAFIATSTGTHRVPALPSRVLDVTGAGDAFSAGFLVTYLQGGNLVEAAQFGCATASLVIESTSGVGVERMPTAAQVHARIAQHATHREEKTDGISVVHPVHGRVD